MGEAIVGVGQGQATALTIPERWMRREGRIAGMDIIKEQ
jgi:hypothetical protein